MKNFFFLTLVHTALLSLESICYARMAEMCNIFAKNLAKEIRGPDGDDSRKMFAADFPVTLSLQLTNAALFGIATAGGSTFFFAAPINCTHTGKLLRLHTLCCIVYL